MTTSNLPPPSAPEVFRFEGELTLLRGGEFLQQVRAALAGRTQLTLDLSAVTEVDCAGLQLVLAVLRSTAVSGVVLRLQISDSVRAAFVLCRLTDALAELEARHGI